MMKINKHFYFGFLGFMGFKALGYFFTHEATDLYYLMFFAFFGYFFIGRLNLSMRDEAYLENERKASHASLILALFLLCGLHLVGIFAPSFDLLVLVDLSVVILALFYSIKLYLLERV